MKKPKPSDTPSLVLQSFAIPSSGMVLDMNGVLLLEKIGNPFLINEKTSDNFRAVIECYLVLNDPNPVRAAWAKGGRSGLDTLISERMIGVSPKDILAIAPSIREVIANAFAPIDSSASNSNDLKK